MVVLVGLALRLWGLGRAPTSADQAVVGLMAHEILRGHFFAFFWGQPYGGGEAYVVAIVFAVAGQSVFTLGLTPLLLDAIAALLLWRIGRRLFSPHVAAGAALLFWVWPEVYVQLATIEYGFRWLALCCGLTVLLQVLRITDEPGGRRRSVLADWAVLGLALGVGWWSTPEIAYYAIPAIGLLLVRVARRSPLLDALDRFGVALALATAGIGALPWIWANVRNGFLSINEHVHTLASREEHFRSFFAHTLPLLLGVQLRLSGRWIGGRPVGLTLYLLALAGLLAAFAWLLVRRRALVLVAFSLLFPFGYAIAPTRNWGDGRYAIYLAPVLALLVTAAVESLWRRRALVPIAAALLVGFGLTLGAMVQLAPYRPNKLVSSEQTWADWQSDPNSWLQPVIGTLHRQHISDVWSGYWAGTVLTFESHSRITASDLPAVRYRPYTEAVEHATRTAWLFLATGERAEAKAWASTSLVGPGCILDRRGCLSPTTLETYLRSTRDRFQVERVGYFLELVPSRPVDTEQLLRVWH